jgi:hypothetical protein
MTTVQPAKPHPLYVVVCGMPRCGTRQFTDFLNQSDKVCIQAEISRALLRPLHLFIKKADKVYKKPWQSSNYNRKRPDLLVDLIRNVSKGEVYLQSKATIHGFKTPRIEIGYKALNQLFIPSFSRINYFYCIRAVSDCFLSLHAMPWSRTSPKTFINQYIKSLNSAQQLKELPDTKQGKVAIHILNLDAFVASTTRAQWLAKHLFAPLNLHPEAEWIEGILSTTGNRNSTERATGKRRDTQLPANVREIFLGQKERINTAIHRFNEVFDEELRMFEDRDADTQP